VLLDLNFRKDVRGLCRWRLLVSTNLYVRLFQVESPTAIEAHLNVGSTQKPPQSIYCGLSIKKAGRTEPAIVPPFRLYLTQRRIPDK
jgi:hypothetical protein